MIQRDLDQTITREKLEEASTHVPTIARADCVRMHQMLAGIFISRISHQEAMAFQRGLNTQGIASDVIPDTAIPSLPEGMRSMRVVSQNEELHFRDFMDRLTVIKKNDILFVAGGCIEDSRTQRKTRTVMVNAGRGGLIPTQETQLRTAAERSIRLDIFFTNSPYRFSFNAGDASRFFVQDIPIHLRDPDALTWAFKLVRTWAPAGCRMNRLIQLEQPMSRRVPLLVYEEEIRWHFFRLREAAKS